MLEGEKEEEKSENKEQQQLLTKQQNVQQQLHTQKIEQQQLHTQKIEQQQLLGQQQVNQKAVAMPMEPFDYGRNMDTLGSRWKRWLDKFELHITGNALTDEDMIKARFLTNKTRKEIYEALTKHFNTEKSEVNEILKFRRALKHKDEPVNSYYLRLRDLSQHC
ncbi:hypothetical protein BpHYR1_008606, partial [Brachionus plicatilis]